MGKVVMQLLLVIISMTPLIKWKTSKFSDGSNLDVAMVNSLVNSMAAFASQQTSGLTSVELRDKYWAQNIAVRN